MRKLTKHIFTEKDNETFCMGRVSWGSSFVAICTLAGATILTGGAVGVVELAVALSTIAAGHGAAIKLKETTEHK
jgi:hypothetical protein